jgi:putative nucleotidyltransferase with HDIG domain
MAYEPPISREAALQLLNSMPQAASDLNHYLESEAIMRALAKHLSEDQDYWGMLGLLHDVDWGLTKEGGGEHCVKAVEILKAKGFSDEFIETVQSHGYGWPEIPTLKDKQRTTTIQHALAAAETVTGLIYAYALMRDRDISGMNTAGLKKKFKDKRFAANCNREIIKECEKLGLSLEQFFEIAIAAMQSIKEQINLR